MADSETTIPEETIEAFLVRIARRASDPRVVRRLNERAGVEFDRSSWTLLLRISEHEPVRLSVVADVIGIDTSTASRQVSPLIAGGMVRRSPDPADGRALLHELTDAGRVVLGRMTTAWRSWIEEILDPFDVTERSDLASLLKRLAASIEEVDRREEAGRSNGT
ncbi:MAG: MarR family winged helix-turn-helix transcriptional regulator [Acidimicrobiales bacterium]